MTEIQDMPNNPWCAGVKLTSSDPLNLGHVIGAQYRIWTGEIDTVLGFDLHGWVVVRGQDGRPRRHLTPVHYGSKRVA